MKKLFFGFSLRMLLVSALIGFSFGMFDVLAVSTYGDGSDEGVWSCPVPPITLTATLAALPAVIKPEAETVTEFAIIQEPIVRLWRLARVREVEEIFNFTN